jgi:site-specific DNA-methyltransferase (adenine-specific)
MPLLDVRLGDCRDIMRTLTPGSVDAVITDPPYGINFQSNHRSRGKFTRVANDEQPFVWWLPDAFTALKDGGAVVCFCRWDTQEAFRLAIEWAGFTVKSQVIWDREWHGMGDLKAAFSPRHDVIWFATKGSFNFPGKRPASVLRSQRISGESLRHPNEKPVDLMRKLIEAVTPQSGVVLDPFAGSGATLIAAHGAGRSCIGIEIDQTYYEAIQKRLSIIHVPTKEAA